MYKFKTAFLLLVLLCSGNGMLLAAPTLASVIKAEESDGKPPVLVDGGLLGALGAGMASAILSSVVKAGLPLQMAK